MLLSIAPISSLDSYGCQVFRAGHAASLATRASTALRKLFTILVYANFFLLVVFFTFPFPFQLPSSSWIIIIPQNSTFESLSQIFATPNASLEPISVKERSTESIPNWTPGKFLSLFMLGVCKFFRRRLEKLLTWWLLCTGYKIRFARGYLKKETVLAHLTRPYFRYVKQKGPWWTDCFLQTKVGSSAYAIENDQESPQKAQRVFFFASYYFI